MKYVTIPTLKRYDNSRHSTPVNVLTQGMIRDKLPHEEIIRAAYYCRKLTSRLDKGKWEFAVSLEIIHKQHHYDGAKKRFLDTYNLDTVSNRYILSNICGLIFLELAAGRISYDEAAKAAEKKEEWGGFAGKVILR